MTDESVIKNLKGCLWKQRDPIVVEMIQAASDTGASIIHDLTAAIIRDGKVPFDWEQSFIVCLYL